MPRRCSLTPGLKRGRNNRPYWVAKQIARDTFGYPDNCVPLPPAADNETLIRLCQHHTARLRIWIAESKAGGQPFSLMRASALKREGFVYFLQAGDRIKIGFTTDWRARLRALGTGAPYPFTQYIVIRGGRAREREMHERFKEFRVNGEWFEDAEEITQFIHSIRDQRVR